LFASAASASPTVGGVRKTQRTEPPSIDVRATKHVF
jgi:hypothetical protein